MILYHGSNVCVEKPRLVPQNRFLDFGYGFYTTTNRKQAESFAQKVMLRRNEGKATVSVYEFDEVGAQKTLKVLKFSKADGAWLDFVCANRTGNYTGEAYDCIIGAVANDDVYQTFLLFNNGLLTREQTLEALKVKKLYDQIVFSSDEALKYLKFVKSIEL